MGVRRRNLSRLGQQCDENKQLQRRIEILILQMSAMQRALYGRSSEKVSPGQLQLFIDDTRPDTEPVEADPAEGTPDYEEAPAPKKKRGPHPGRAPLPAHLEREELHLHPDSLDCPCCGSEMAPAGEEISEELGIVPARFFVRRRVRHKYACRQCEDAVVRPPLPPVAIEKCQVGSDVLAAVIVSKYADHLPLYRQQAIYRRADVELSRVTMGHWIGQCAFLLKPIVAQMKQELLASGVVQSDDTSIKYLEPPGPAKNGYLWAYVGADQTVVYDFTRGRSRAGPESFLDDFQGILQVDGYAAYNGGARQGGHRPRRLLGPRASKVREGAGDRAPGSGRGHAADPGVVPCRTADPRKRDAARRQGNRRHPRAGGVACDQSA
jgi:transposase